MALLATPAVRRTETALNTNISRNKIVTNNDLRDIGVQVSHQTMILCGTGTFDVFENLYMTFVHVFIKICIEVSLFAYTR
jgi:hypothetical protein